ncbi:uncharacterized protein LOC110436927 [Sorghum bicolor]|nr:uncharacterized protein LOC110436927 [Sorghum bicolor]|eukprot:XP_021320326.1 uncharacterized protein LOC110436927 [Sorghum bicolor]
MLDFSYLMILELKNLYNQKYNALLKSKISCHQIYDAAYQLYLDLDPAIQDIYNCAQSFPGASAFSEVKHQVQQIEKEVVSVGTMLQTLHANLTAPIGLRRFRSSPSIYEQANTSSCPTAYLRAIVTAVVYRLHRTPSSLTSKRAADGSFHTVISSTLFSKIYRSTQAVTLFEAEAAAIYRYLRCTTNELGYTILDRNYPTLARLLYELNNYNEYMVEMQLCAEKSVEAAHKANEAIDLVARAPC